MIMDTQIFLLINNAAGRWPVLDWLMIFCAVYLMWVLVIVLLVLVARNYARWRDAALVAIVSAGVARLVIAEIIKRAHYVARPFLTVVETHLLIAKDLESSFPSGHTIFTFALATGVYLYNKKWGGWYLLLACLVGFARIFAGIHWPSDVLVGAVLGIVTTLVGNKIYQKHKSKIGL
jgi:undecaprenyl-diphosphatase